FASQLHRVIAQDVLKGKIGLGEPSHAGREEEIGLGEPSYAGRREIGEFLKARVFGPGASLRWDELVRHATGEELGPRAMMAEIAEADRARPEGE
ncbi:MAG: hypothetical protein ACPMAQ_04090, partial [Phycisphaerae bacterium]